VDGTVQSTSSLATTASVNLSNGTHVWRVRAENSLGNSGGWSIAQTFTVGQSTGDAGLPSSDGGTPDAAAGADGGTQTTGPDGGPVYQGDAASGSPDATTEAPEAGEEIDSGEVADASASRGNDGSASSGKSASSSGGCSCRESPSPSGPEGVAWAGLLGLLIAARRKKTAGTR
jgi:MYXO-CTERM domain-containing protein